MKNTIIRNLSIILVCVVLLTATTGCNKNNAITKEEAYNLYYDIIEKFVPELMTEPQECDVEITTRDEVTYITDHFVRNLNVKIQSQNVDGKLQYYLLDEFPEAEKFNFYCINDDKYYAMTSIGLNNKGTLLEHNYSTRHAYLFANINTPLFELDAIKSFKAEKNGNDTQITFVVDGTKIDESYSTRVMREIYPRVDSTLDDAEIILNIDENGTPKTMSVKASMSIYNDSGKLHAQKILNMEYKFNKLDDVNFNLQNIISKYATNSTNF